ncbi:MAG: hypothetical protein JO314_08855 [Acidobacteria bacterium]|nr:hypothetical protein [Acidobacteriota bacterium]
METTFATKLKWNLPWLVRYPLARCRSLIEATLFEKKHVIITVANHFEPAWSESGPLDHASQIKRLKEYRRIADETGDAVRDVDGTKFRHTNFYPAEQYHPEILDIMAGMQADGLGEVEVHLHHGVDSPDTAENLERQLVEFRDVLAQRHKCLSVKVGDDQPKYAFVHGNLALANSCGGRFCGVDNEMQILASTGCYADMTLPSAPDQSQVRTINEIYECGHSLDQAVPHRDGIRLGTNGKQPQLPLIMQGPLVFNWTRTVRGIPVPRIDDGALAANQDLNGPRFRRWMSANVTVAGRSDWVFVKLYCHGFFDHDQSVCIGDEARKFFGELVETGEKTGKYAVHFASAREAFNIAMAANEGLDGDPNKYRDHILRPIMGAASVL